jgi:hypothetical protein
MPHKKRAGKTKEAPPYDGALKRLFGDEADQRKVGRKE